MSPTDPSTAEPAVGRCRGCGYALRGLASQRCPECGRAFDPADPRTMNMGRSPGRVARVLLRMPGWPTLLAAVLATAAVAYATRPPVEPVAQWTWSPIDLRYYANPDLYTKPDVISMGPGPRSPVHLTTTIDLVYAAGLALWFAAATWFAGRFLLATALRLRYRGHAGRLLPRPRAAMAALMLLLVSAACAGVGWPYRLGQHWAADYLAARERAAEIAAHLRASGATQPALLDGVTDTYPVLSIGVATDDFVAPPPPLQLSDARIESVLRAAARWGDSPRARTAAVAIAMESAPRPTATRVLEDVLAGERRPEVLAPAVRALSLLRRLGDAERFERLLDAPHADVRAAAADALGIVRDPAFDAQGGWQVEADPPLFLPQTGAGWGPAELEEDRPGGIFGGRSIFKPYRRAERLPISPTAVARLNEMMIAAPTPGEREAAARAVLPSPPAGNRLRVAEWGVWVDAAEPVVAAVPDTTDGIPPFAHRFGDPVRQRPLFYVTVPVLHFTTDVPLAVDLSVQIRGGRATYAYPRPDDYSVSTAWRHGGMLSVVRPPTPLPPPVGPATLLGSRPEADATPPKVGEFERPDWPRFTDRRAGFPWLQPACGGGDSYGLSDDYVIHNGGHWKDAGVTAMGFRWQSLIVTPDRRPWMQPPTVPADPKFAWWGRLRDVPCGWVSSRGEAERFVYYDGPSHAPPAVVARPSADRKRLTLATANDPRATGDDAGPDLAGTAGIDAIDQTGRAGRRQERRGMYVAVRDGVVTAEVVPVPQAGQAKPAEYVVGSGEKLVGPAVEARLREWVIDAGLSGPEADGMIAVWRTPFVGTEGTRFVTLMAAVDYDGLCPMTIRPRPTELVRVGLVWAEFGR